MNDTELLLQPVSRLSELIRTRALSASELAEATLRQISLTQPQLNAYLEVFESDFLSTARSLDDELSSSTWRGPLHGIPIGLKDLVDIEGKVTTCGSAASNQVPATADATIVKRLRRAGAIIAGKTNLVEFAFGFSSVNPHTGNVLNPWNLDRVAAGSSSGSAAAVASGAAAMAIGTDTGGSVRMPAAACGITGLKPTYGVVPRTGVADLSWSNDHVGPMCRTATDCALMMDAIASQDSDGHSRVTGQFTTYLETSLKGIKIGVPTDYFFSDIDTEIESAVREAIHVLRTEGADVSEIPMPWVSNGRAINVGVLLPEAAAVHHERLLEVPEKYSLAVRHRLLSGLDVSAVDYIRAQRARAMFCHQVAEAMSDIDVLVTPTVPIQTPTIAETTPPLESPFPPAGGEFPIFTGVFNATGQPSISLNCGFTKDGMPIGLMFSGRSFEDARVLGIASAYQRATDWACKPPSAIAA